MREVWDWRDCGLEDRIVVGGCRDEREMGDVSLKVVVEEWVA